MVRRNSKKKRNLACVRTNDVKDKTNCDCCGGHIVDDICPDSVTSNGSSSQQEVEKCCVVNVSKESNCRTRSSRSCACNRKCITSVERIIEETAIIDKCIKDFEKKARQNGICINVCKKKFQDSCSTMTKSSNGINICELCPSMQMKPLKATTCSKYGCVDLQDTGVCRNIPSVMQHIEECKKKFLDIIEDSLGNIGKNRDPEKIIRSTLRAAKQREMEKLLAGKAKDSVLSEGSSKVEQEAEEVKKFCKNDLLVAAYNKLMSSCVPPDMDVCGPCGSPPDPDACARCCASLEPDVCRTCNESSQLDVCRTCNGSPKSDVCTTCNGSPTFDVCKTCNGSPKFDICKTCNGSPKFDVCKTCNGPPEFDVCTTCNGSPKFDVCKTCNGSPKFDVCKTCNGSPKFDVCKTCNGSPKFDVCQTCNGSPKFDVCKTCNGPPKFDVCGPCGIENAVPCVKDEDDEKLKKCLDNSQGDYKDEEISEFIKIIDRKLREELTKKLRKKICADDTLALKNSYYCVATLCPCMTKKYCMRGPLVLGPFNFAPQEEQAPVMCQRQLEKEPSICGSASTLPSFHYSDCVVDANSSNSSVNSDVCSNRFCPSKIEPVCPALSKKTDKCTTRRPILLDHHDNYVYCPDRRAEDQLNNAYSKKSEEVAKWGKCYDFVDSVLYERDERMKVCNALDLEVKSIKEQEEATCKRENCNEDEYLLTHVCGVDEPCLPKLRMCKREENDDDECPNICSKPSHTCRVGYDGVCVTGDDFDNLDRFHDIGSYGFAKLCRKLFKWVNCISKNWNDLRSNPHIVVHLPSLSFPNELRCRASKTFDYLQNSQVGRIGWLDDPNVQVLYIFPTPQSEELLTILQELITSVRPDIDLPNRLWMIRPEPKCVMKKCVSGSANLFYSSDTYRRVRYLTAGRHAVILPGVIDQNDIFIGCELKMPIMGPPMKFQKKLLNKSHVMELLDVNKVQHPPFLHVHSIGQLCRGMAILALEFINYKTWFVKIDNGFRGHHTAVIRFHKGILGQAIRNIERTCNMNEDYLCKLFSDTLPAQMQVQKSVYRHQKEFIRDLEVYGGIIQACPNVHYDVINVGVFIEHDLAEPVFQTAGEVIHFGDDIRHDMAYFLPQNKIHQDVLNKLVESVGTILRNEHVVGYFGIDIVTFRDQYDVQQCWVVDVDPYYTDLIAFSDWVRFCLGPWKPHKDCTGETKFKDINVLLTETNRHVICCGNLFGTGLAKYCGSMLMTLCKQNQIFYDNQEKMGTMIYPTDCHNRALSIVSINTTRLLTMKKFIEALRVLNELSLRNNGHEAFTDTRCFSNYLK